jgi:energy-coupling factor transporter ATP-binding protein EcfA2
MNKFEQSALAVYTAVVADLPFVLWGPPGTGKTKFIETLAGLLNRKLITIVAATRDRTDFGGWPIVIDGEVVVRPFPWAKEFISAGKRGMLFIDELTSSPPDIRPVLLRILNERYIGDVPFEGLPLAAANPEDQAVTGFRLDPPIANRLLHFEWSMEPHVWGRGMREGWEKIYPAFPKEPSPELLEAETARARALISSYVERNPGNLNRVPEGEEAGRAWPSYRTWDYAARFLGACFAMGLGEDIIALGMTAAVGKEGYGFVNFLRENDLPSPEEVLEDFAKLPKREDALFVVLSSVASYVIRVWTPEVWGTAWRLLEELVKRGQKDLAFNAAKALAKAHRTTPPDRRLPTPKEIDSFIELMWAVEKFVGH